MADTTKETQAILKLNKLTADGQLIWYPIHRMHENQVGTGYETVFKSHILRIFGYKPQKSISFMNMFTYYLIGVLKDDGELRYFNEASAQSVSDLYKTIEQKNSDTEDIINQILTD